MRYIRLFFLLTAAWAVSVFSYGQNGGLCGSSLNWYYDGAGTLTISGSGSTMYNFSNTNQAPWTSYRNAITTVVFSSANLTNIGNYAFLSCTQLKSITIPSTVSTIGSYAFSQSGLESITIPSSVTTIGANAFNDCSALRTADIPTSVTSIGSTSFFHCPVLATVKVHWTSQSDLPTAATDAFTDSSPQLIVPCGASSVYNSTLPWRNLTIVEECFYNLRICGTRVSSLNCSDLSVINGVTGTVSYDPTTNILTLEDAVLTTPDVTQAIWTQIPDLKIVVKGACDLNTPYCIALRIDANTTIEGYDVFASLKVRNAGPLDHQVGSTAAGTCYTALATFNNASLTIHNCLVETEGAGGILLQGSSQMTVNHARVTALTVGTPSSTAQQNVMRSFKASVAPVLIDCELQAPAGVSFSTTLGGYTTDNSEVTREKVVIGYGYDLWVNGTQVTDLNCGDITAAATGVTGTVKYDEATNTLTLNNASITASGAYAIKSAIPNLTISVLGANTVTGATDWSGIRLDKSTTVTGGGRLMVGTSGTGIGIFLYNSNAFNLTENIELTVTGSTTLSATGMSGISGFGNVNSLAKPYGAVLTVDNARVVASFHGNDASLSGARHGGGLEFLHALNMNGVELISPSNAVFYPQQGDNLLIASTNAYVPNVYIGTPPEDSYYRFDNAYNENGAYRPYMGNGDMISFTGSFASSGKKYLNHTYSRAMVCTSSTTNTIPVYASESNPAHVYVIGSLPSSSYQPTQLLCNSTVCYQASSELTTANNLECLEYVTTCAGLHNLSTNSSINIVEIRVVYENNPTWQAIENAFVLEINADKNIDVDIPECTFFRMMGRIYFDGANGTKAIDNQGFHSMDGIFFTVPADGVIEVDASAAAGVLNQKYMTLDSVATPGLSSMGPPATDATMAPTATERTTYRFPHKVYKGKQYKVSVSHSCTAIYYHAVRFIPDYYTVTLNPNGGEIDGSTAEKKLYYIKDGDPITGFPTPTREGYEFVSWSPVMPSFPYRPAADITYTAQWVPVGFVPEDSYYCFTKSYAAGASVAPIEGNGADLVLASATFNGGTDQFPRHYFEKTHNIIGTIGKNNLAQEIMIYASEENPAHIHIVGKRTTNSTTLILYYGDEIVDQTGVPVEPGTVPYTFVSTLTTTHSGIHKLSFDGTFQYSVIRVIYEQNELYTRMQNSLSLELNETTTLADNPEVAAFFILHGCRWASFTNGAGYNVINFTLLAMQNVISLTPYADGQVLLEAVSWSGTTNYNAFSPLTRPSNHYVPTDQYFTVNPTSTTFIFDVQKDVEYVLDGNMVVSRLVYMPTYYTVTLDPNGGEIDGSTAEKKLYYIKDGCPITGFPTPSREGYEFAGWSPVMPSFPYRPAADITYTAQWKPTLSDVLMWHKDNVVLRVPESVDLTGCTVEARLEGDANNLDASFEQLDFGVYRVSFAPNSNTSTPAPEQILNISFLNSGHAIACFARPLPLIISGAVSMADGSHAEVVVDNDGTLTIQALKTGANSFACDSLTVNPGGRVVLESDYKMRAGAITLIADGMKNLYPEFVAKGQTGDNATATTPVRVKYIVDNTQYYPFSLPYTVSGYKFSDLSVMGNWELHYYDGAARATGATGWTVFDDRYESEITCGRGFSLFGLPDMWNAHRQSRIMLPFAVSAENLYAGENANKKITVNTYESAATNNSNWNLIGNPFMRRVTVDEAGLSAFRYITIPENGFRSYTQELAQGYELLPFHSYFVQTDASANVGFQAPARALDEDEETALGITLSQGEKSDHAGLLLGESFTRAYELNADLQKMFGSKQPLSVYAVNDGIEHAFMAVHPDSIAPGIALGFRQAQTSQPLVFRFDDQRYDRTQVEQLLLRDNKLQVTVDLMQRDYTFTTDSEQDDTRFVIEQVRVRNASQGMENVETKTLNDGIYDILGRRLSSFPQSPTLLIVIENGQPRKILAPGK